MTFANSHKIQKLLARIKGLILLVAELRKMNEVPNSEEIQDILEKINTSAEELDNALNQTAQILNRTDA